MKARNELVTFAEKPHKKINSLNKQKHAYLIHTWSEKVFHGVRFFFRNFALISVAKKCKKKFLNQTFIKEKEERLLIMI